MNDDEQSTVGKLVQHLAWSGKGKDIWMMKVEVVMIKKLNWCVCVCVK